MAETLTELVAKIKTDASGLEKGLTDAERKTEASSKKMSESLQKVGMAMAASGAAITAALSLMGKAAIDEEINIKRLATTINNSGTAYDSVKDSLEAVISATQRKTGVADDEQRNILNRLILVTNDYNKALELMPTVLDLAAAGEMDATTAATYLGKAYLELEKGAETVSVRFGQASLQFKNMEDIQNRVAGAAENLANPLSVLKASLGDVAEAIGMNLIPIMKVAIDNIVDIAIKIQEWTSEHPELAKQLTLIAGALGIFLGVVGTALLLVPKLKAAWITLQLVFTASPWGAIIAGIVLLIAAGILLWQNWDKVSHFFSQIWFDIKMAALTAIDKILEALQNFADFIPGVGDKIEAFRNKISDMAQAEKVKKDLNEVEYNLLKSQKAAEKATEENDDLSDSFENLSVSAEIAKEKIATLSNSFESYIQRASNVEEVIQAFDEAKSALEDYAREWDNWIEKAQFADSTAGQLNITFNDVKDAFVASGHSLEEFEATLRDADVAVGDINGALKATEISALDAGRAVGKLTEAERKAKEQTDDLRRAQERLIDSWNDFEKEISEVSLKWKAAGLSNEEVILGWAAVTKQSTHDIINSLVEQGVNISDLRSEWESLGIPLAAITKYYENLEEQGEKTAKSLEDNASRISNTLAQIAAQTGVSVQTATAGWQEFISTHQPGQAQLVGGKWVWPEFASGGKVPGPIGQPMQAIVHGGENIIPADESMGNVILNISGPLFMEREDQMNQFVDKISKTLDRKYRLRFGGAYSG